MDQMDQLDQLDQLDQRDQRDQRDQMDQNSNGSEWIKMDQIQNWWTGANGSKCSEKTTIEMELKITYHPILGVNHSWSSSDHGIIEIRQRMDFQFSNPMIFSTLKMTNESVEMRGQNSDICISFPRENSRKFHSA